eukprot:gene16703-25638_t
MVSPDSVEVAEPPLLFPGHLCVVMHRVRWYYAIGNTPATNLLVKYSEAAPNAGCFNVLCLGCGDLRHCLFSLPGLLAPDGTLQYDATSLGRRAEANATRDSDSPMLTLGTVVRIDGLKSAKQHNRKSGKVLAYLAQSDRYSVQLLDGGKAGEVLSIRRTNLVEEESESVDLHYFINDSDPHVIARNILLLECMADRSVPLSTTFAIWFSIELSVEEAAVLESKLEGLIALHATEAATTNLEGTPSWSFHGAGGNDTRSSTLAVWRKWHGCMRSPAKSHGEVVQMRRDWLGNIQHHGARSQMKSAHDAARRASQKGPGYQPVTDAELERLQKNYKIVNAGDEFLLTKEARTVLEKRRDEAEEHRLTGNFRVGPSPNGVRTNVTLFWNLDAYDLHYRTDSFAAFADFVPADPSVSWKELCLREFSAWALALRAWGPRVRWTFSDADCRRVCAEPRRFDVVSTSNMADHIGLLNLVALCRPYLTDHGVLFTNSMHCETVSAEYVHCQLQKLPPELWATFTGCRPVGLEAWGVCPVGSLWQAQVPGPKRELQLCWVALPRASILGPCALQPDARVESQPLLCTAEGSEGEGSILQAARRMLIELQKVDENAVMHYHRGSVLPVLAPLLPVSAIRGLVAGDAEWDALNDVFFEPDFEGTVQSASGLFSVSVAFSVLDEWDKEPQPLVFVRLEGGADYHGAWCSVDGEREVVTVFFFAKRTSVHGSRSRQPDPPRAASAPRETDSYAALRSVRQAGGVVAGGLRVREHAIPREKLRALRTHFGFPDFASETGTSGDERAGTIEMETERSADVVFRFVAPAPALARNGARALLLRRLEGGAASDFEVVDSEESSKATARLVSFSFGSTCLAADLAKFETCGKTSSDATGCVVRMTVPKRAYEGVVRGHTESSFIRMNECYPDLSMDSFSGMQMDEKEGYIARSREASDVPPLIALKDSFMFFYQCRYERVFLLTNRKNDKGFFIINHGLLTNRETGIPWVDVSVCMLTPGISNDVLPLMTKLEQRIKEGLIPNGKSNGIRFIFAMDPELDLFRRVLEVFHLQCFAPPPPSAPRHHQNPVSAVGAVRAEHPDLRNLIPEQTARQHFKRAFLSPLFPPVSAVLKNSRAGQGEASWDASAIRNGSLFDKLKHMKESGNALFRDGNLKEAVTTYQLGIRILMGATPEELVAPGVLFASLALYSNLAHCYVSSGDFKEALIAADCALSFFEKAGDGVGATQEAVKDLVTKVWKRKQAAHEGLGQTAEAAKCQRKVSSSGH